VYLITDMIKKIGSLPKKVWGFVKGIGRELKLMEWVSVRNVVKSTGIVILLTSITTLFIILADSVIAAVRDVILSR